MQYHDHAKGTPPASPAPVERANPDRLLSGMHLLLLLEDQFVLVRLGHIV